MYIKNILFGLTVAPLSAGRSPIDVDLLEKQLFIQASAHSERSTGQQFFTKPGQPDNSLCGVSSAGKPGRPPVNHLYIVKCGNMQRLLSLMICYFCNFGHKRFPIDRKDIPVFLHGTVVLLLLRYF